MGGRGKWIGRFVIVAACVALPSTTAACGFHSSFLSRKVTPKQWWEYHKHEYLTPKETTPIITGPGHELSHFRRKGDGSSSSEGKRALIAMVLEHLMYLNSTNVRPSEFPEFNPDDVSEYLKSFKDILVEIGADIVPFLLDALLNTSMIPRGAGDLTKNETFRKDVTDILERIGMNAAPPIAAYLARTTGSKSRETLLDILGRVLGKDEAMGRFSSRVRNALSNWERDGGKILEFARDSRQPGTVRNRAFRIWLGLCLGFGESEEAIRVLQDKEFPYDLRGEAVAFLARNGVDLAVGVFLALLLDRDENVYLRKCCVEGIWTLRILSGPSAVSSVLRESRLKTLLLSPTENTTLRVICLYLLTHLDDTNLLTPIVKLLNRTGEDTSVRMAALKGLEPLRLTWRASRKVDKEILLQKEDILAYRFRLLDFVCASKNMDFASPIVRIIIDEEESVPVQVRSLLALKEMRFPGFFEAEEIILEKTKLVERARQYVLDGKVAAGMRVGVIRDLGKLYSFRVYGSLHAFLADPLFDRVVVDENTPLDLQESLLSLFLKVKGARGLPRLRDLLENPASRPELKSRVAVWAGENQAYMLMEALRKAVAESGDPLLMVTALHALQKMGQAVPTDAVASILLPSSRERPGPETFEIGLGLLARIGGREALKVVARCVQPPPKGEWSVTAKALGILGSAGQEARVGFPAVWGAYWKSDPAEEEIRKAFQECFIKMGPSFEICAPLIERMEREIKRFPLDTLPRLGGLPTLQGKTRRVIPGLHATLILHAYRSGFAGVPDFSDPRGLALSIKEWYRSVRKSLPRK